MRATGIGWKFVSGRPTDEASLQLFVGRKRARGSISTSRLIPRTVAGFATDVISNAGAVNLNSFGTPSQAAPLGAGFAVASSINERGTLTCAGRNGDGAPVVLTAAHVAPTGSVVTDDARIETVGRSDRGIGNVLASDLYPGTGDQRPTAVDVAVVLLPAGVTPSTTLPGGSQCVVQDWRSTLDWMSQNHNNGTPAEAATFGAFHTGSARTQPGWRRGVVISFLPRAVADGITYFCAIDDGGKSVPGDSGSLWIGQDGERLICLGIHHGILNAGGYALVADLASALPLIGVSGVGQ